MNTIYDDVLARLRDGETIEDVAQDMVTAINDANSAYQAEQEAARIKAAADLKAADKDMWVDEIAELINDYVDEFYPEWVWTPITASELIDLFDSINTMQTVLATLSTKATAAKSKATEKVSDPIRAFLKSNGLL